MGVTLPEPSLRCGTALLAQRQSAGRGQRGRSWRSPVGGLYLSVALPALPVTQSGQLMLSCAWGIATALQQFNVPVALKWPNDFVIGPQKLGGMLIETQVLGSCITRAVIGVGINWRNPVPASGIAIAELDSSLGCGSIQSSIEPLAAAVLTGIAVGNGRRLAQDAAEILPDYEAQMTHLGQTVTIVNQGGRSRGRVVGVAPTGQLRVCIDQAARQVMPDSAGQPSQTAAAEPAEIWAALGSVRLSYDALEE